MGMIRGALVTLVSILLFLTLLSMNTMLTISLSLDYDLVQPGLTLVLGEILKENLNISEFDDNLPAMALYCQNNTEYPIGEGEFAYNISCDKMMLGGEAIVDDIIVTTVEEAYYKEYDCEFLACTKEGEIPFFLFSQKAKSYWQGWFNWSLIAVIVFAILLWLFMENRNNWPFLIGILLIIASLPFLGIDWLATKIVTFQYAQLFLLFFTQSHVAFLLGLVLGIVLIGIGIVLKFLNFGEKLARLTGWFSKDKKKSSSKED